MVMIEFGGTQFFRASEPIVVRCRLKSVKAFKHLDLCMIVMLCLHSDSLILVWPTSWTPAVGGLFVCECMCV